MSFNFKFELKSIQVFLDVDFDCECSLKWKSSRMISDGLEKVKIFKGMAKFEETLINQVSLKINAN